MVRGRLKSRTYRRVQKRTPGNKVVVQYVLRKPKQAHCGSCGAVLHGIPRGRPVVMRNLPKSKKTVARPYGGNLCSKCSRALIRASIGAQ